MQSVSQNYVKSNIPNPWAEKVSVLAVYPTHQAGTVKAFATIKIGDALEIRSLKVIQQAGQRAWVAMPDRKAEDGKAYFQIVKVSDERLMEAISAAVLAAWSASAGGAQ